MYKSLRSALMALKDSSINYVMLRGYNRISENEPSEITILTDNRKGIVNLLDLKKGGTSRTEKFRNNYLLEFNSKAVNLIIYDKGKGIFPEQFETQLIVFRIVYDEICHIPDFEREFWAAIYMAVVHEGQLTAEQREPILRKLRSTMGITKSRYSEVGYYVTSKPKS